MSAANGAPKPSRDPKPTSPDMKAAQDAFDACMKDPAARKRLKTAAAKTLPRVESEIARIEGATPDRTKLPAK